ncbi:MAG: phosphocholine cytidylyltransferase family protein [Candidatus Omnitrophica bacterium]|nr:phosphocholine cytidylyltransferase family protein [Candidatus Omnitrophota bacterium]
MRALILAAGRGSRMGNLTVDRPKCLLSLGGKTLLEWQLEALRGAGIREIGIVAGYLAERLKPDGVTKFLNPNWERSNMVASLLCADEWLRKDVCVVSYADIVYPSAAVAALVHERHGLAITYDTRWLELWRARFEDPLKDAETFKTDPQGRLVDIGARAKSLDEIKGQYMGLLKFTPAGWNLVRDLLSQCSESEINSMDMTSMLRRLIQAGKEVHAVPIAEPWYEVDNLSDLTLYTSWFKHKP